MNCSVCGKPLSGGLDTYGDVGAEVCEDCWYDLPENNESWYGMAPHAHDLTITGSVIGSTVFTPLPEPDANGVYEVNGCTLYPTRKPVAIKACGTRSIREKSHDPRRPFAAHT